MSSQLSPVAVPASTPIDVEELKTHLRISHDDEDNDLQTLIFAAVGQIDGRDGWLGRALITQQWQLILNCFPATCISIPLPPLQSIDEIRYLDAFGAEQTLSSADYTVHAGEPATLSSKTCWPSTACRPDAVKITFTAGYGDTANDVPALIRQYLKIICGGFYLQRESVAIGVAVNEPPHIQAMLNGLRVYA